MSVKNAVVTFLLTGFIFLCACSSFIPEEVVNDLKDYEKYTYSLNQDVVIDTKNLERGDKVRILVETSDNWIKVYAYKASEPRLKADRFLILYLFEEDFPKEIYDNTFFKKKLMEKITKIK